MTRVTTLVVAVEAKPPVVPVAAGPCLVTTLVTMIGVGVSPARVADGVTVTTLVAVSKAVVGVLEAVTIEVAVGGTEIGAGTADDGAGALMAELRLTLRVLLKLNLPTTYLACICKQYRL